MIAGTPNEREPCVPSLLRLQRPGHSSGCVREAALMLAGGSHGQLDLFDLPKGDFFISNDLELTPCRGRDVMNGFINEQ